MAIALLHAGNNQYRSNIRAALYVYHRLNVWPDRGFRELSTDIQRGAMGLKSALVHSIFV